jgi:hypothetical protein
MENLSANKAKENPVPPELRDLIVNAAGALGDFESTRLAVKHAARAAHYALMDLWDANPWDPYDDDDREAPGSTQNDLAAVRARVLAAVTGLTLFPLEDGEVDGLRLQAITLANGFLAVAPSPAEIPSSNITHGAAMHARKAAICG